MCSLTVSKTIYFPFSRGLVSMGNVISANVNSPQNVSLSERFATENYLGGGKNISGQLSRRALPAVPLSWPCCPHPVPCNPPRGGRAGPSLTLVTPLSPLGPANTALPACLQAQRWRNENYERPVDLEGSGDDDPFGDDELDDVYSGSGSGCE